MDSRLYYTADSHHGTFCPMGFPHFWGEAFAFFKTWCVCILSLSFSLFICTQIFNNGLSSCLRAAAQSYNSFADKYPPMKVQNKAQLLPYNCVLCPALPGVLRQPKNRRLSYTPCHKVGTKKERNLGHSEYICLHPMTEGLIVEALH